MQFGNSHTSLSARLPTLHHTDTSAQSTISPPPHNYAPPIEMKTVWRLPVILYNLDYTSYTIMTNGSKRNWGRDFTLKYNICMYYIRYSIKIVNPPNRYEVGEGANHIYMLDGLPDSKVSLFGKNMAYYLSRLWVKIGNSIRKCLWRLWMVFEQW